MNQHKQTPQRTAHKQHKATKRKWIRSVEDASFIKREMFYALENAKLAHPFFKFIGYFLFFLIVANAIVIFVSTQPGLDPFTSNVLMGFYAFSTICFFLEYLARIWIADLAFSDLPKTKARLKYIFSPFGLIDFLSFFPSLLVWFFPASSGLRYFVNIVRLVRLIKVSRYMRGLRTIGRVLMKHRSEIVASFLVIALLVCLSSVVMYEIENPVQPDNFNNLLSGLYWAITTITSTGYGDLVPITPLGRIVGLIIMFLSIALVAIPGGIFSAGFVAEFQNANRRQLDSPTEEEPSSKAQKPSSRKGLFFMSGDGDDDM